MAIAVAPVAPAQTDTLFCGTHKWGLTEKRFNEIADFLWPLYSPRDQRAAESKRNFPNAFMWQTGSKDYTCINISREYSNRIVAIHSFNGCSSVNFDGFGDLALAIGYGYFHGKYIPEEKISREELLTFALQTLLYSSIYKYSPCFFNLPPRAQGSYDIAYKFLEAQNAEIACQFINPNYPERKKDKQYTTLFVLNTMKFMYPNKQSTFKGLVK